ncbi:MAG: RecB family exonuclease [Nanobdellota archaeon]
MAIRTQSPSSINMYKQCPRKYYYRYIEKRPTKPSIHLVRGNVAHSVLEEFFDKDLKGINELNYDLMLKQHAQKSLAEVWKRYKEKFDELDMTNQQLSYYFDETMMMVLNFVDHIVERIKPKIENGMNFRDAFKAIIPSAEEKFVSKEHKVMGFIDAIENRNGKICIMDYKTSKRDKINEAYKLQLSIYTLLYHEKYGNLPDKVGIFFLKHSERFLDATEDLLKDAKFEIEQIHMGTESDNKADYPMKPGPLCKWSTGECDYYELCFPNGR